MAENSRLNNTKKNVMTSFLNQGVTLVLSFVCRTIFINHLGVDYLGINGLFANILQVLSMADLGFGTAIVYSMYKPIRDNDEDLLAALLTYYKKIYNIIAAAVFVIGMAIIPVLPYIVNLEKEIPNLRIYYVIYLMNTVVSYLFVYKTSITTAHQKSYILNNYDSIFVIIQYTLQITSIILFKNFIIYLTIMVAVNFVRNLYKTKKSEKLYPYIKKNVELDSKHKKDIFTNIKSMFIYKIGSVVLNNTDNIIISIIVGTVCVGYYSNYLLVINAVMTFTNLMFSSVTASIGDLNADSDAEKKFVFFHRINFIAIWIFSFCGVCFFVLFNDFIILWLGEEYLLDFKTLIVIVLNFVMPGTIRTVSLYRDTTGIFKKTKYVFFVTSIINVILSITLGKLWGLFGILLATVIARLLTNVWFEPYILFKEFFNKNVFETYTVKQLKYWAVFIAAASITYSINLVITEVTYVGFIAKIAAAVVVPNLIFFIMYRKKDEFKYLLTLTEKYIPQRFRKK